MNRAEQGVPVLGLVLIAVIFAIGTLMTGALLPTADDARATHVSPTPVPGNPTCSDFQPEGAEWNELKMDPPGAGVFSDTDANPGPLEVSVTSFTGTSFNWSSNMGVDA